MVNAITKMCIRSYVLGLILLSACLLVNGKVLLFDQADGPESKNQFANRKDSEQSMSYRFRAKKTVTEFLKKYESESTGSEKSSDATQCGYESCQLGKEGFINVHIVPHTHDDVGWLKTVDQYFYGDHNGDIQHASVQYIIDTVIDQLHRNADHRFIYVEMAFFSRWWHEQDDITRHMVKGLVNAGRLEFILGGWCMNDEASTHYSAIIDQHTLGFHFLKKNFGECGRPRIGWQIDPFGHSRETASLFAQFGFDGLFFARLDYQDMDARQKSKTLESIWRGSSSLGDQASLFTGVLFNGYGPPAGFCFECGDEPIKDDPTLEDYNVDNRVNAFLSVIHDQAKYYSTNNIMFTMGSDFQFENALVNFKNLDKLIKYTNDLQSQGSKVNVFYSTPSCYTYSVNKANISYTHKEDDFFPYANDAHAFWTGYFTSRAALKGYERSTNNFFQVCKQLDALALLGPEHGSDAKLRLMRDAMGVAQHHDAVSGTEKQPVAYDYAKRLSIGSSACQDVVNYAFSKLLPVSSGTVTPVFDSCTLTNVSYCIQSEKNNQFIVIAYNPYGRQVSTWVRVPVVGQPYTVLDSQLQSVTSQIVPLSTATRNIPDRNGSISDGELVFLATIPPVGFNTYFVKKSTELADSQSSGSPSERSWVSSPSVDSDIVLQNEYLKVTFSSSSGLMTSLTNLEKSISTEFNQTLMFYKSYYDKDWPPSGAYIFRPNGTTAYPVSEGQPVLISLVQGSQVQEVRQMFGAWGSQVVRLYNGTRHLEIEWTVGPIPVNDTIGKEVISRFSTSLETNSTFYTDANGREIQQRIRDYRATWKLNQTEPVAGNYYPVNSRTFMRDVKKNVQLTILNDRSQGGASINDGQIELMLHRRVLHDDSLGVGDPLNEPGIDGKGLIVRGKHYIYLDDIASSSRWHREAGQRLYMAPSLGFAPLTSSAADYAKNFHTMWSALKGRLPDNVHLLTLEQWEAGSILIRFEHFFEKNEDPVMSQDATVQMKDLFVPFNIDSVVELTLGANQRLSDATRLQWTVQDYGRTQSDMKSFVVPVDPVKLEVLLKPMQIRTFQVTLK